MRQFQDRSQSETGSASRQTHRSRRQTKIWHLGFRGTEIPKAALDGHGLRFFLRIQYVRKQFNDKEQGMSPARKWQRKETLRLFRLEAHWKRSAPEPEPEPRQFGAHAAKPAFADGAQSGRSSQPLSIGKKRRSAQPSSGRFHRKRISRYGTPL